MKEREKGMDWENEGMGKEEEKWGGGNGRN
jgi:hypothetical protein